MCPLRVDRPRTRHRQPWTQRLPRMLVLAGALLAAGCAVQPNNRGGLMIGVDTAELFGRQIGGFRLADGTPGSLRHDPSTGAFSVKIGSYRVVPIPNAVSARIAMVAQVESRLVVIVETQERNCNYKYTLMAIEGTDVLQWDFGNCRDRPQARLDEDGRAIYIDFPEHNSLKRYSYMDQRLYSGRAPAPAGVNLAARPFADENLRPAFPMPPARGDGRPHSGMAGPGRPNVAGSGGRVIPAPPQRAAALTTTPPATPRETPAARETVAARDNPATRKRNDELPRARLTIPDEEIKPVRIDLRK
ncbi:hypothetical protein ACSUZJ_02580 [Telluria sp. B2]